MHRRIATKLLSKAFAAAIGVTCASTSGQVVYEFASLGTEPTVLTKNGVFTSCGFRFFGAAQFSQQATSAVGIDGSIMITEELIFLSKAGRFALKADGKSNPQPIPGEVRWIKLGSDANFAPVNEKIIPGERGGYHLFATEFTEQNYSAFIAPSGSLWISFSGKSETGAVYAGTFMHTPSTLQRLSECMESLTSRISRELSVSP